MRARPGGIRALALGTCAWVVACSYDFDQFAGSGGAQGAGSSGAASATGGGADTSAAGSGGSGGAGDAVTTTSTGGSSVTTSSGSAGSSPTGSGGGEVGGASGAAGGGGSTGSAGAAGTAGASSAGGASSGGAGSSGGGSAGASAGGASGAAGLGGSAGTGGSAGSGSSADASDAPVRDAGADVSVPVDAPPDVPFCSTVGGVVYQGHCYFRLAGAFTWDVAATSCPGGAHLVTITSSGEQTVVAGLLAGQDNWIGMRMPQNALTLKMESSFYWVTGEPFTPGASYTDWDIYSDADKEPNFTGACVRMEFNSKWADGSCTVAIAAICEHD